MLASAVPGTFVVYSSITCLAQQQCMPGSGIVCISERFWKCVGADPFYPLVVLSLAGQYRTIDAIVTVRLIEYWFKVLPHVLSFYLSLPCFGLLPLQRSP